jgi:glucan phosphorylase
MSEPEKQEVKDASGELQRRREEAMKKQIEERKKALIDLIMRQTDYDEETANIKLAQWNNNYLNVIKEYMNPNFQEKPQEEKKTTKNQMIYGEIRNFMDDVNRQALWRKRQKIQMEKKREAYIAYLKQQAEQKSNNSDTNVKQ